MASLVPTIPTQNNVLQTIQENSRKTREGCRYTEEERRVIGKYKKEYRKLTTREARAELFQTKILVDIFNFWDSRQMEVGGDVGNSRIKVFLCDIYVQEHTDELIRQDLGQWIKNNWRAERIIRSEGSGRRKSAVDLVWATMKGRVRAEQKRMWEAQHTGPGEPGLPSDNFSFTQRTAAAKKVLDELGEDDRAAIEKMLIDREKPEVEPEIKQE
jgi:hypothetical protein